MELTAPSPGPNGARRKKFWKRFSDFKGRFGALTETLAGSGFRPHAKPNNGFGCGAYDRPQQPIHWARFRQSFSRAIKVLLFVCDDLTDDGGGGRIVHRERCNLVLKVTEHNTLHCLRRESDCSTSEQPGNQTKTDPT